jgi:hypothetical protein
MTGLPKDMRISALKMDQQLMLVTGSAARAEYARLGSSRLVVCFCFHHMVTRGCPRLLAGGALFVFFMA